MHHLCMFLISVCNFQVLFLEFRKLEKIAEGNIEMEWLMDLLKALLKTRFAWSMNNKDILGTSEDDLTVQNPVNIKQVCIYTSLYG